VAPIPTADAAKNFFSRGILRGRKGQYFVEEPKWEKKEEKGGFEVDQIIEPEKSAIKNV